MADRFTTLAEPEFLFGPFRLLPAQQILLEGRAPVRIGSRALEILTALVEHPGQLVSRGDLIARAWPNTFVEEANLNVHIGALRRALGEGQPGNRYVATVPGRGYRFVAPVKLSESGVQPVLRADAAMGAHNLPAASTRLIGRVDEVDALLRQVPKYRFVTVVGPGGIGKTTVALAAAEALLGAYKHGVWFINLAPLRDPHFLPGALASALELTIHSGDPMPALVAHLRDKQMLILLDSCEHLVEAAAAFVEQIIGGASGLQVLVTSPDFHGT